MHWSVSERVRSIGNQFDFFAGFWVNCPVLVPLCLYPTILLIRPKKSKFIMMYSARNYQNRTKVSTRYKKLNYEVLFFDKNKRNKIDMCQTCLCVRSISTLVSWYSWNAFDCTFQVLSLMNNDSIWIVQYVSPLGNIHILYNATHFVLYCENPPILIFSMKTGVTAIQLGISC